MAGPGSPTQAAPPSYDAATQGTGAGPSSTGSPAQGTSGRQLNQGALNRLGAAGVRVPALGIGGDSSGNGSTIRGEGGIATPLSRLALSSPSATTSSGAPGQNRAAVTTFANLHRDQGSVSAADARSAASAAVNFNERHGDKVATAYKRFGGAVGAAATEREDQGQGPGLASSGLGALIGKKAAPPPPPPKRVGAREDESGAASSSPPPVPMATKPR